MAGRYRNRCALYNKGRFFKKVKYYYYYNCYYYYYRFETGCSKMEPSTMTWRAALCQTISDVHSYSLFLVFVPSSCSMYTFRLARNATREAVHCIVLHCIALHCIALMVGSHISWSVPSPVPVATSGWDRKESCSIQSNSIQFLDSSAFQILSFQQAFLALCNVSVPWAYAPFDR